MTRYLLRAITLFMLILFCSGFNCSEEPEGAGNPDPFPDMLPLDQDVPDGPVSDLMVIVDGATDAAATADLIPDAVTDMAAPVDAGPDGQSPPDAPAADQ